MDKYRENLEKALRELKIADHIIYITYSIVKDKRLLLKALDQEAQALAYLINAILQYEYLWKHIKLYNNSEDNFHTFVDKCSKRYNISPEEIETIKQILKITREHKKSPMEFLRKDKIIILGDNLKTTQIDLDILKVYLELIKKLVKKALFVWKTTENTFKTLQ